MKMSKNLSVKYYQENKGRLQKKAPEWYQNLSKEEKEKKATIFLWTLQKSLRRWKKLIWLSIEKNIIEWRKTLYYNYKKVF